MRLDIRFPKETQNFLFILLRELERILKNTVWWRSG